ncbi:tyrosine-type recombinase/integrase [Candidatus Galacturonibacter soehngenii]|uniref:tyrosine-type recombinase/integrase n=1 Tax=Candidatus Galacturonatibacter soehngenii TaxID=2307010 RepID=UPI00242F6258|nr:tyrosine-type recombinase/integrase [Candidatus Galacturonibacter soehngenii]
MAYRAGLRVKEIARLHSDNINLEKGVIEVREGSKNGKFRDVSIRTPDIAYFTDLKEEMKGQYICRGVSEDSLNRGIRRVMQDLSLDKKYYATTIHSIRKLYASERMQEEREKGLNERDSWCVVQQNLGHGNKFREELYKIYIK